MKFKKRIGLLLLAAWLILTGLMTLVDFNFASSGTVMAILAIAAGVLIVLER